MRLLFRVEEALTGSLPLPLPGRLQRGVQSSVWGVGDPSPAPVGLGEEIIRGSNSHAALLSRPLMATLVPARTKKRRVERRVVDTDSRAPVAALLLVRASLSQPHQAAAMVSARPPVDLDTDSSSSSSSSKPPHRTPHFQDAGTATDCQHPRSPLMQAPALELRADPAAGRARSGRGASQQQRREQEQSSWGASLSQEWVLTSWEAELMRDGRR
jgi:hypothetical protein